MTDPAFTMLRWVKEGPHAPTLSASRRERSSRSWSPRSASSPSSPSAGQRPSPTPPIAGRSSSGSQPTATSTKHCGWQVERSASHTHGCTRAAIARDRTAWCGTDRAVGRSAPCSSCDPRSSGCRSRRGTASGGKRRRRTTDAGTATSAKRTPQHGASRTADLTSGQAEAADLTGSSATAPLRQRRQDGRPPITPGAARPPLVVHLRAC